MAKYIIGDIFEGNYTISQYYGNNPAYYMQFNLNGHEGVDWATPVGVNVLAPFDGQILRDNDDFKNNAYGDFIVVWDPIQKCAVWFCHLSGNTVSAGQTVKKGQVLGQTGNTGNSSGPHLHINFVETDASGNRLNLNNTRQGFLNILDSNLVQWKLGGTQETIPVENQQAIIDQLRKERDTNWNMYVQFKDAGYDNIDKVKTELKSKQDTIDNLNNQVSKLQSESTAKDTTISSLTSQVTDLTKQVDRLSNQSDSITDLQKLYDQLQQDYSADKLAWAEQTKKFNYEIAGYKNTSYKTIKTSTLFSEILRRSFHING